MTYFKDNFSKQSSLYFKYRPLYSSELYSFLSTLTADHELAWDCGTGNGQAAIGLASLYDKVIATDPSEQQIKLAFQDKKIIYHIEKAEQSSLESNSVDLITCANALHWFDFKAFYKEVNRVLKNNGIIAVWAYGLPSISKAIDEVIKFFHDNTLNDYWLVENRLVENEYRDIPFPFSQIDSPEFNYEKNMNLHDWIGYLNTWSATQRFIDKNNFNPTDEIFKQLIDLWGDIELERAVNWKLILKLGKKL